MIPASFGYGNKAYLRWARFGRQFSSRLDSSRSRSKVFVLSQDLL